MPTEPATKLLNPEQVAAVFNVTPSTVRAWAREGRIDCVRTPGGQIRFRQDDVDAILAQDGAA